MALPDISALTHEELGELINAALNRQEEIIKIESTPGTIQALADGFIAAGGDPDLLPDLKAGIADG